MTTKSAQEFVLKTVYKNDVRRVRVDRTRFGWKDLNDLLRKQFKDVSGKRLTYVDEDGDTITMTNQEELDEYFRVAEVSGWKSVKIQVRETIPRYFSFSSLHLITYIQECEQRCLVRALAFTA